MVIVCRPGFEEILLEEIAIRLGGKKSDNPSFHSPDSGLVVAEGLGPGEKRALEMPLIFERQRLPAARLIKSGEGPERGDGSLETGTGKTRRAEEFANHVLAAFASKLRGAAWTIHVYPADPQQKRGLGAWVEKMENALQKAIRTSGIGLSKGFYPTEKSGVVTAKARDLVMQLCIVKGGVWVALAPQKNLSAPWPGGVDPTPGDREAPSRSYLKIEEAFRRMGLQPKVREKAVDLGAAPGGWSYALLKRGCRVLAVDNGAMKIQNPENLAGELEQARADGMTFRPPPGWNRVDWLVSDMLVPPGKSLGLMRRWLQGGWLQNFIVNIKLPQKYPLAALRPIADFLAAKPDVTFSIRQLYHDRREVTLMGSVRQPVKEKSKAPGKSKHSGTSRKKRKKGYD